MVWSSAGLYLLNGATEGSSDGSAALGDGVVRDSSDVDGGAALDLSEGPLQGATERPERPSAESAGPLALITESSSLILTSL